MTPLIRLVRKLREAGPVYTGALLLYQVIPQRVLTLSRTALLAVDPVIGDPTPVGDGMIARWGTPDDHHHLRALGMQGAEIDRRFAGGHRVYLLLRDDEPLVFVWFVEPEYVDDELGLCLRLAPHEMGAYDGVVAPQLRGKRLYPRMMSRALASLAASGYDRVVMLIDAFNRNSLRAHVPMKAHRLTVFALVRLRGQTLMYDEARRRVRLGSGGAPVALESGRDF